MLGFGSLGELSLGQTPNASTLGLYPVGWEPAGGPQPPHPRREKFGAIAPKEDGTEAKFIYVPFAFAVNWQTTPQEVQPPGLRVRLRVAGILPGDAADQNDKPAFIQFFPDGWAIQPPQPPARIEMPNLRAGAIMRGDDGAYDILRGFFPYGWPIQPPQPPHPAPERRAAGIMLGDYGAWDRFSYYRDVGWIVQDPQPPHPVPERRAAGWLRGDDGIEHKESNVFQLWGFDAQPPQPPHWPRPAVAGSLFGGDSGIEYPFFAILHRFDMTNQAFAWRRPMLVPPASFLTEYPPIQIDAADWAFDASEIARYRRMGPAIENPSPLIVNPLRPIWGFDHSELLLATRRPRHLFAIDEPILSIVPIRIWIDQVLPTIRSRPRRVQDRLETIVAPLRAVWGWNVAPPLLQRPHRLAIDRGYELVSSFPPRWTSGWDIQLWQPPHFSRARAAAGMRGDDGNQWTLIIPQFYGWAPTLFWPPHPRPERAGGIMAGDFGGAWGPFIYLVPSGARTRNRNQFAAFAFDIGQAP